MHSVNNERSWKIVKIELQLQNAERWKSKHMPHLPHTHTAHIRVGDGRWVVGGGKVNAYE